MGERSNDKFSQELKQLSNGPIESGLEGLSQELNRSLDKKISLISDKNYRNVIAIELSKLERTLRKGGSIAIAKVTNGPKGTTLEFDIRSQKGKSIAFTLTGTEKNSSFSFRAYEIESGEKREIQLIGRSVEHGDVFGSIYGSDPDGTPSKPIHGLFVSYLMRFLEDGYILAPRKK